MEKDVDEVGKIARSLKSKIEELDKEVNDFCFFFIDLCPPEVQMAHVIFWRFRI